MSLADAVNSNFGVPSPGAVNDKLIAFFRGIYTSAGSPEGVVTAPVGSFDFDLTNGNLYKKATGSGNTGWTLSGGASGGSGLLASYVNPTVTVINTAAESTLFSLAIPGGVVSAGNIIKVSAVGDALSTAISETYTLKLKIGTTTVVTSSGITSAANANRWEWYLDATIWIVDGTNQKVGLSLIGDGSTNDNWGALTVARSVGGGFGTSAEDTSIAKNVILTTQMTTADAAADMRLHAASLTLWKP